MQLQNRTTSEYFYVSKEDCYYLRMPDRTVVGARSLAALEQGVRPDHHVVVVRTTTVTGPSDGALGREVIEWRLHR